MSTWTQLRVTIPTGLHAKTAARARQDGRPVAQLVTDALEVYLEAKPTRSKRKPSSGA